MSNGTTRPVGANDTGLSTKEQMLSSTACPEPAASQVIVDDPVIVGAESIARVIYGEIEGRREGNIRRIYHAISKKDLPTFSLGGRVHARRSKIMAWIERQEQAGSAA